MSDRNLDVVPGTLELLILRTLAGGGRLHGFAILDWIRETTGEEIVVEEGALYPALHRMEKRGLLQSDWDVSDKGRRARFYKLTSVGRRELSDRVRTWERYVEAVARLGRRAEG